jgi:subtilisin family serine protease
VNVNLRRHALSALRFDRAVAAQLNSEYRVLAADPSGALDQLVARRRELADERRVAIERFGGVLAAAGELIVAGPHSESATRLLGMRGFEPLASVGGVTRLVCRSAGMDDVLTVCRALRALGVPAGPNTVSAAGVVIKGLTGLAAPRPTAERLGARPDISRDGAGVRVAVVDTGIDPASVDEPHGWLAGIQVDRSATGNCDLLDAVPAPDGLLDEGAGHGTFVAGVVRQAAPACEVIAVKALDSDGIGTDFSVAEALFRLADSDDPPEIVNLSLACLSEETVAPVAIEAALAALTSRHPEVLVVAAAGNDAGTTPTWPAANKSVLAVAALDGDRRASYSNHGYWVDFCAAASGIVSTYVRGARNTAGHQITYDGPFAAWSGTSFAAPQVAGALAVLRGQGLSAREAVAQLRHGPAAGVGLGHRVRASDGA